MLPQWFDTSAEKKIIGCFLASTLALFINNIYFLILLLGLVSFTLMRSKIKWQQLKPFIIVISYTTIIMLSVHGFLGSFFAGMVISLQMSFITLTSCYLVHTSNEMELIAATENFLRPLKRWGVNPEKISLGLLLTVRSIALLSVQYQQIRCAQQARGLDHSILAIIMPLLMKAFRAAANLAEALQARGYEVDQ